MRHRVQASGSRARGALAVLAVGAAIAATSCGGGGGYGGSGGVMNPGPGIQPTFASIQSNIFTPRCALSGCHAGTTPQQGMDLSAGHAYTNTVNVASVEQPAFMRILPGNADNSYLFMKLVGDARITPERMPRGGPYLSTEELNAVRDWINAGAANAPLGFPGGGTGGY